MPPDPSLPVYPPTDLDAPTADWGNEVVEHLIHSFTNATERDTRWPSPPTDALAFVGDTLYQYDGAAWGDVEIAEALSIDGNGDLVLSGDVSFSKAPQVRIKGDVSPVGKLMVKCKEVRLGNFTLKQGPTLGRQPGYIGGSDNLVIDDSTSGNNWVRKSSTRRVKKDIEEAPGDVLADLVLLRPVTFRSIVDDRRHIGFVAEEAHAANPVYAAVNRETGEIRGLDTHALLAGLVAWAQRQEEEISALEAASAV